MYTKTPALRCGKKEPGTVSSTCRYETFSRTKIASLQESFEQRSTLLFILLWQKNTNHKVISEQNFEFQWILAEGQSVHQVVHDASLTSEIGHYVVCFIMTFFATTVSTTTAI